MSFILDALKKSDHKRQDTSAPRLDTVHDPVPAKKPRRTLLIGLVLLALVLNGGLVAWFLLPGSAPRVEQVSVMESALLPAVRVPRPADSATVQPPAQPAPQALTAASQIPPPAAGKMAAPEAGLTSDRHIYQIDELPATVRGRLPELHMSLHAYRSDEAAASLVRINDRIMREGDLLGNKYLVEEITPGGVVFRYQGYRFILPRKRT